MTFSIDVAIGIGIDTDTDPIPMPIPRNSQPNCPAVLSTLYFSLPLTPVAEPALMLSVLERGPGVPRHLELDQGFGGAIMTHPSRTAAWARTVFLAVSLLAVACLLLAGAAPAQDADTLARNADKKLRDAQRQMFSGKLETAQQHLATAADLIAKLKAADANHSKLRGLESKYARQKRDLDRRLPKEAPGTVPTKPSPTAGKANKLPGAVTHRLRSIDKIAKSSERILESEGKYSGDWAVKQYENSVQSAVDIMAEIQKSYGDRIPAGHPEVKAREATIASMKARLAELKQRAAAKSQAGAEAETRKKAQSEEWMAKLKPFVAGTGTPGHDPTRYLIAAGTSDLTELERRKKIHDQAAAAFAAYRKVEFPAGKTDELEQVEKKLAYALESFASGYQESLLRFLKEAETSIQNATDWFKREEARDDGKQKPNLLQKDILPGISQKIAVAASTVARDDPRVKALNARVEDLEKRQARLRQLRKERTFLTPDRFQGEELATIKTRAAEFLKQKHGKAAVLRTTVISENWKEEKVLEHTDTTKTAIRYRVTRSVTAQIAGKEEGEVFLFTLHVAKDRQSDGTWGALHGHVMFVDPMLEKNVEKNAEKNK